MTPEEVVLGFHSECEGETWCRRHEAAWDNSEPRCHAMADALDLAREAWNVALENVWNAVLGMPTLGWVHTDECAGRPGFRGICNCVKIPLVSMPGVFEKITEART